MMTARTMFGEIRACISYFHKLRKIGEPTYTDVMEDLHQFRYRQQVGSQDPFESTRWSICMK